MPFDVVMSVLLVPASALLLVLSALLERSGPVRLRHWVEEAGPGLRKLFEEPARFETYRFLLASLARALPLLLLVFLDSALVRVGAPVALPTAALAVIVLVLAVELANRRMVGWGAEEWLRRSTLAYRLLRVVLMPLIAVVAPLAFAGREPLEENGEEEDDVSDEEIEAFIEMGTREGILEPAEGKMVWGIVDFGDTQVRSVMTPRVDMVGAPAAEDLDVLAELFLDSGHSRIPLFEDSIDKIVGILHIRDLLRGLRSASRPAARELAKPPFFVPERRPLDELLKEMQARYQQLAIVLDEYGGTAGLVTVEDLLEEIVGEIFDEDEVAAELEPMALPDGSWRLDGRTPVEALDELFDVDLDEEPYETVAGVVLAMRGAVPAAGETVDAHGLRFDVEEVVGRRIRTVRVEKVRPSRATEETA